MTRVSVQIGVLAIAKDLLRPDRSELTTAVERATGAGHRVMVQQIVHDDEDVVRTVLRSWVADKSIDAVVVLGGAASESVSRAVKPLVTEALPGFTDLFRWLMFQEAGATAMLASAEAARCGETFVFVLPGAIGIAMDKLILPQFDPATTPKNLLGQMPRLRELGAAPKALTDEASTGHGVPKEVPFDKTQGGSGMPQRLPAVSPSQRARPKTGAHVILRADTTIDDDLDPPTKPIDLERLQRNLAASSAQDAVTRPIDLDTLLPADVKPSGPTKPPPGKRPGTKPPTAKPSANPPAAKPSANPPAAKPSANPASFVPSATGSFGLVDDDLEEVDAGTAGGDLEAIRAASQRPPTKPPPPPQPSRSPTQPPLPAPVEAKPVESKPVESKPVESKPVESKPVESKPVESKPVKPVDEVRPAVEPAGPMFGELSARKGMSGTTKALLAVLVLGGGAAAAVLAMSRTKHAETASVTPSSAGSEVAPAITVDAAQVAVVEIDAAALAEPDAEIEIAPTQPTQRPVERTRSAAARTPAPSGPVTSPSDGPATRPSTTPATPPPPTEPAPPPASDGCDEAACVLSHYEEACCAKFKPSAGETFVKRTDGVPDTLDKTMVRTAINGVKPKVQKCGEQTPVKGIVKISLTVDPEGKVSDASLDDSPDPTLGACVLGALKLARFGKTVNGATFTYPFQF